MPEFLNVNILVPYIQGRVCDGCTGALTDDFNIHVVWSLAPAAVQMVYKGAQVKELKIRTAYLFWFTVTCLCICTPNTWHEDARA